MDTETALVILAPTLAVVLMGLWLYHQSRVQQKREAERMAALEAQREAKRRDVEAQARYDRTRRAAGLPTASDYTPRRSAPLPAYRPPVSSPASVPHDSSSFGTSMLVAQATDSAPLGYMAGGDLAGALLGASMSSHHTPSPAPAPSYDWGSSSSCDSSSSSSGSYDSGSSSSSSCDSSSSSSSSWD